MSKRIFIKDTSTDAVEFEQEIDGGYSVQYTLHTDEGQIHHFGKIDNAKYGDKHWIKNLFYEPIAKRLVEKFEELKHIRPERILFIEDVDFTPSGSTKDRWIARIKAAKKELNEAWGYMYILETRGYYIEQLNKSQLVALIYHELRHIGPDWEIIKHHEIEDWNDMVDTLGRDWATEHRSIADLLADDFIWHSQRHKQISLTEFQSKRQAASQ